MSHRASRPPQSTPGRASRNERGFPEFAHAERPEWPERRSLPESACDVYGIWLSGESCLARRERHREHRPFAFRALRVDPGPMQLRDRRGERKPQTVPPLRARFIGPIEALKDMRQIRSRNSDAEIAH